MRFLPICALAALALLSPRSAPAQETGPAAIEDDGGFLTRLIEGALSDTAREVRIQGFAGALSSRATIERLTIADGEGIWLDARDLALDWSRSALFAGRIEVEELTAGSIDVLRPPIPDPSLPSPEATPFALPDLPVSVRIGELRADRIALGPAILGEAVALEVAGTVTLEGGEGEARLAAQILEGSEGRLLFDASFSNATRILALDLDLQEAPGGIVARALDLPGLPSVALRVDGTGPIDDWRATVALATDGAPRVSGEVALQAVPSEGDLQARAFGLDIAGDVTPLVAPEAGAFFGPDLRLRAKGIRRGDGSVVVTSLGLSGAAVLLDGAAEIAPDGWPTRLSLAGRIAGEDGAPVPLPRSAATVRSVTLDVAFDAALGDEWTGSFVLEDFAGEGVTLPALTLAGSGTIRPPEAGEPGAFTAELDYAASGLAFADAGLAEALGSEIAGQVALLRPPEGGPLRVERLTLSGPGVEIAGSGSIAGPAEGGRIAFDVRLQAADLGRFAVLSGLDDLGGAADLAVVGGVRPLDGIFDVAIDGTTDGLRLGIAELDPLLAGAGRLRLAADRDETGTRLNALRIETPLVLAEADADITSGQSSARFDLAVADLGLSLPGLEGPGRLAGTFERDSVGQLLLAATADLPGATAALRAAQTLPAAGGEPVSLSLVADLDEAADYAPLLARLLPGLDPSGGLSIRAGGRVEADLSRLDIALDLVTRDLALGIDALDLLLAGEGEIGGRLARTGPGDFVVEGFRIETDLIAGTAEAAFRNGTGTANLDLSLADVAPLLPGLSGPARVTGTASPAPDGAVLLDLAATLPQGEARIDGRLDPARRGVFEGEVALDLPDLAPFAALAGRDLSGAAAATLSGRLLPDLSEFDLSARASTTDLALGLGPLDSLLAGEGRLSGRIARSADGALLAEGVEVETALLSGTADAAFDAAGRGTATLDLALADVAPLLPGLAGPGRLAGTVSPAPDGTLALDLEGAVPGATLALDGTLDPADGLAFAGDAEVVAADLAPWGPLLGRDLGGALTAAASGRVRPDLSELDLAFDARFRDLRLGLPALEPLLAGEGRATGRIARDAAGDLAATLSAQSPLAALAASGRFGATAGEGRFDLRIEQAGVILPGLPGPLTAQGTAARMPDGNLSIVATAGASGAQAVLDATVAPPEAGSAITGTARVSAANLAPFGALAGTGLAGSLEATIAGTLLPDLSSFDLSAQGTATALDPGIPALVPLLAGTGRFDLQIARQDGGPLRIGRLAATFPAFSLSAQGTDETVAFDARLADVALFAPDYPGPATATGTATFGPAGVALDAAVTGPGGIAGRVAGTVGPAGPSLGVTGTVPLGLANPVIEPRRLEGAATLDLRLEGGFAPANLSGTVTTAGARLADPALGVAVTDIAGTATLGGGTAQVQLSGALSAGGTLALAGSVGLVPPFVANLSATGTDLVIRDPALYTALASAQVTVTGPLAGGAAIAGTVLVDNAEIRVPTSGVGALGDLPPVFHIEPSLPVRQTLARADAARPRARDPGGAGAAAPFSLDLLLSAPARVFVRGRGLDAELGGTLRLTGTTAAVVPIGQFSLIRGRFDILGQRFVLTEGSATLQGAFVPFLRLVATTQARSGAQLSVILEGPADAPEVTFASSPELPQDEVLAQLLFGRSLDSITPFQAVQLAAAAAQLAGGGDGVVDRLRGGAGLADLDFTVGEDGGAAVRLGQYLTENIYTDVVVGTEQTTATINLDLTQDLTVRAGVTTAGETTLGIYFERDY
ncbi:translocation/assembly module TamB domain-containing protein [Rubellimicrobium sp. CFH 75288]|uniref:translocation/assembly module TamB domain-containing protein n=1 Tax=Rubellimicrobium sp. CFH 75288 TaxID=2697034 RepID=UPI00141346A8|nr:translocation/assembly module TamB domain-containing protein [Rubellimicrobium sp. CFH 75288]NAZ37349.1 hypothetical protein [Rubellimicrobium sp. CFH 75288]